MLRANLLDYKKPAIGWTLNSLIIRNQIGGVADLAALARLIPSPFHLVDYTLRLTKNVIPTDPE